MHSARWPGAKYQEQHPLHVSASAADVWKALWAYRIHKTKLLPSITSFNLLILIHSKCPLSLVCIDFLSIFLLPSKLVSFPVCLILIVLTFVTITLLQRLQIRLLDPSFPPWGSGLPPDLAQTVIPANQHTSQQCPEELLALQRPAASESSCKQSIICLCLWIKCLCGGLSAYAGQCVFIRSLYM